MNRKRWDDFIVWEKECWMRLGKGTALDVHSGWFWGEWMLYCKSLHDTVFERALDIGIGASGGFVSIIPNIKYRVGLDPLISEIASILPFKRSINYVNGFGEDMPFEDKSFDLVVLSNALEHCKDMNMVISEVKRVMTDDGYLIVKNFYFNDENHPHSIDSKDELLKMLDMKVIEGHELDGRYGLLKKNPHFIGVLQKK